MDRKTVDGGILRAALIALVPPIIVFVGIATDYVKVESVWFVSSFTTIRVSTVITAFACFASVLFMLRKNALKSIYYASLAVIFSMGLYEFVWYNLGVVMKGFELLFWPFAALFGWILLGIKEIYPRRPPRLSAALYAIYLASMIVWIGTGFVFNDLGNPNFSIYGEVFNIVSKAALPMAYALHIGAAHADLSEEA
jgi:hypothetical protein